MNMREMNKTDSCLLLASIRLVVFNKENYIIWGTVDYSTQLFKSEKSNILIFL